MGKVFKLKSWLAGLKTLMPHTHGNEQLGLLCDALASNDLTRINACVSLALKTSGRKFWGFDRSWHKGLFTALMQMSPDELGRLDADRAEALGARPEIGASVMMAHDIRTRSLSRQRADEGFCAYGKQYLRMLDMACKERLEMESLGEAAQHLVVRHGTSKAVTANAAQLLRILNRCGKHAEAIEFAEAIEPSNSVNERLHRQLIKAQYSLGRYDEAHSLLDRLEGIYEPDAYFELLVALGERVVAEEQSQWMNNYILAHEVSKKQILQALPCLSKYGMLDAEFFRNLETVELTDIERLELAIAFSENRQLKTLTFAELGQNWESLEAEAAEQERLFAEFASSASSNELELFTRQSRLLDEARDHRMLTETSFSHAYDLAMELNKRIKARIPTSFVRLGDGEAAFLGREESSESKRQKNKMLAIWWGAGARDLPDLDKLEGLICEAVLSADVIGLTPPWRIFDTTRYNPTTKSDHLTLFYSALERTSELRADTLGEVIFTSAHAHQALLKWDLFQVLLQGVTQVSTISPHDISQELLKRLGISVRTHHRTPPEHAFVTRFSDNDLSERMYPDRMRRIVDELDVRPGEVVLVAAGFVGKYLCKIIKDRGGIGLDVGSVADYFKGHDTRVYAYYENHVDLRPHTFQDRQFPLREICPPTAGDKASDKICFSDATGTRDILPLIRRDVFAGGVVEDMSSRLLVTGHPRCASGFVASFMHACNVKLGHERHDRDGLCSWMHACADLASPWGDPRHPAERFPNVVAYARDPMSAMASIALENCQPRSFRYRRFNIMRSLGVDIAAYETPLARAVASYAYWYRLVLAQRPAGIIRVESAAEDIARLQPVLATILGGFDVDQINRIDVSKLKRNESKGKFTVQKPCFRTADWEQVPSELIHELHDISASLGYPAGHHDLS